MTKIGAKPTEPVDEAPVKVRKPRSKPPVAAEIPTIKPETVQGPTEAPPAAIDARLNTAALVKAEAPATAPEYLKQLAETKQEAA